MATIRLALDQHRLHRRARFGYGYQFPAPLDLPSAITLPNGANIVNSYDTLARLTGTALNNYWGHTLDGYAYTPDPLGLRTNIVRNLGLTTNTVAVRVRQHRPIDVLECGGNGRNIAPKRADRIRL